MLLTSLGLLFSTTAVFATNFAATCPEGTTFEPFFSKCYQFNNDALSFAAAELKCQSIGGHLAPVSSAFENSYIATLGISASSYWIGANLLLSSTWTWTSNDSWSYANWALGQPADLSAYQCGAIDNATELWMKQLCYSQRPYVCSMFPGSKPPSTCTTPTPSPALNVTCPADAVCSGDYTFNNGDCKCYKYFSSFPITFKDARTKCKSEGGDLAMVKTAGIEAGIKQLGIQGWSAWIGFTCTTPYDASTCTWIDGSAMTYTNFAKGEVGGEPAGQYGGMMMGESNREYKFGQWFGSGASAEMDCICSKDSTTSSVLMKEFGKSLPEGVKRDKKGVYIKKLQ